MQTSQTAIVPTDIPQQWAYDERKRRILFSAGWVIVNSTPVEI